MSAFSETLSQDQGRLQRLQAAAKRNPADAEAAQRLAVALSESRAAFAEKRAPNFKGWLDPADRYRMPDIEQD